MRARTNADTRTAGRLMLALLTASLLGCVGQISDDPFQLTDMPSEVPNVPPASSPVPHESPAPIDRVLTGPQLYAQHCAGCHGALEASPKRGKSAAQIRDAIATVVAMQPLRLLSDADVVKIEAALQTQQSIVQCHKPALRGASRHGTRRLTRSELDATLATIVPAYWKFQDRVRDLPELDEMSEIDRFDALHSKAQVMQWSQVVSDIGEGLAANPDWRQPMAGCFAADTVDEACWRTVFTDYGKKVFRRPVSVDEANRLTAMVKDLPTAEGVYLAAHLLFRSPDLLFHIETGTREEGERVRLSSYEVANRISYGVVGAPPDAELLAAAAADGLQDVPAVQAHVERLIGLPAAKQKLRAFFAEWLQLSHVARPHTLYLDWILKLGLSGGLETHYQQEIYDYLFHVIWTQKGTFRDLMTAPIAFPRFEGIYFGEGINKPYSALAGIYGNDKFSGFTPEKQEPMAFPAPNHPGLAMRAGFLSGGRFETSPILRGVFVLRRLLCESLPSPDFTVVNERLDIVGAFDHAQTPNHVIVSKSTDSPQCVSCHAKINPVGFALEAFDSVGRSRTNELVYDTTNLFKGPVANHPLPYPIAGLQLDDGPVRSVATPLDLAGALGDSAKARACMSIYLLRHLERRVETVNDGCALHDATQVLAENEPVLNLFVRSVANEDIFWRGR